MKLIWRLVCGGGGRRRTGCARLSLQAGGSAGEEIPGKEGMCTIEALEKVQTSLAKLV